jgi:hypothetical protein
MSSYIQGFANTAISTTKAVNTYVQDIPYAGKVWSLARDKIVLPGAALAVAAWNAVQPKLSEGANWTVANKGTASGIVIGVIALALIGRVLLGAPSLENQLKAAQKAQADHQANIARLDQAHKNAAALDQKVAANKDDTAKKLAALTAAQGDVDKFASDVLKAQTALDNSKKPK